MRSIRLPFQKLDTMMLNDIRLFLRDRKSLVLVVLTPFIILSILINIFYFSNVAENIRGVELGVCDMDGSGFSMESEIFKVTRFTEDCESLVADKVSRGELRGAIVIPKGFEQDIKDGIGTEITLFVDNSKSTTAVVTSNAVKAYVSDLNEKIGTEFILDAWEQLRELNKNLKFLVGHLEKAVPVAENLKDRLDSMKAEIDSVDFGADKQAVSDMIAFLDQLDAEMAAINDTFAVAAPAIPQVPVFTYTPNASLAMKEYRTESGFWRDEFCNTSGLLPVITKNPFCVLLDNTDGFVDALESDVASLSAYSDTINQRIAELNNRSAALNQSLTQLAEMISSSSAQNRQVREDIAGVRSNLIFLEDRTENISRSITELEASLSGFLADMVRVTDELDRTTGVLDEYTQKDPASILKPVTVDTRPVFGNKLEIFYKLPALISIILLFIMLFISSSLIVNERRGGTMARIFLSPISMFFYVFEKTIYLLLLSLLAVLSMVAATYIFGVGVSISLDLFTVFLIASLVYISIGILVGSFSKSENTSLLTCLVIGFPLMFMSGVFSPPELMSQVTRIASDYLPLTLNINLIENITIYHTGIDLHKLLMMACMILVFYISAVLIIRKKPTLK